MAIKKPNHSLIVVALYKIIANEGTNISIVFDKLKEEFAIKNWMTMVRGPMQAMKNAGLIDRTEDIYNEIWFKVSKKKMTDEQVLKAVGLL